LEYLESKKQLIADIIYYAKDEVKVLVYCSGENFNNVVARAQSQLKDFGFTDVEVENLVFIESSFDKRVWIRDFGAHTIYKDEVDSRFMIDWLYDPEYKNADTIVSPLMSTYLETDLFATTLNPYDLKFDGGNLLTDGLGLAIASTHIFDDNQYDEPTIDAIMNQFLGFDNFIKLEKLEHNGIHHVDMYMKMLNEETILIGEFPDGVADGPQIEENIDYLLSNFKTSFGTDFKIHRISMPADRNGQFGDDRTGTCSNNGTGCYYTYTNAFFINELILVPIYFDGEGMDEIALNQWKELMPGYKIVGIDCSKIIQEYGAIHCVTKEIGVKDPLRIIHEKIKTARFNQSTKITAIIQHQTGIDSAKLFYALDGNTNFQVLNMTRVTGEIWEAELPKFAQGTEVSYYINAKANSGKSIDRPLVGARGPWKFNVDSSVSTQDVIAQSEFKIFPNPSKESFQIKSERAKKSKVSIFDYSGKSILTLEEYDFQSKINTSNLSNGIYLVKIDFDNNSVYKKLIIND